MRQQKQKGQLCAVVKLSEFAIVPDANVYLSVPCHGEPLDQYRPSKSFQSISGRSSQRVIRPLVTDSIFAAKATPGCRSLLEIRFVKYVRLMPHRVAMARRSAGLSDLKKAVACSFMEINTIQVYKFTLHDTLIWCYDATPNNTSEVMILVNMLYITGENHARYTCNTKTKPAEDSG
nr:MAG TPA: hypothetical protein [Caudoviricetes sp.]